jgi:hypothetical protein
MINNNDIELNIANKDKNCFDKLKNKRNLSY